MFHSHPPAPVGQQGPTGRNAAPAARARRIALGPPVDYRGGLSPCRTGSFRPALRVRLTKIEKTRTTSSRPAGRPPGGRLQIGTMAGFKSEWVAGFNLECMAGFIGIRTCRPCSACHQNRELLLSPLRDWGRSRIPALSSVSSASGHLRRFAPALALPVDTNKRKDRAQSCVSASGQYGHFGHAIEAISARVTPYPKWVMTASHCRVSFSAWAYPSAMW
jgi:hypothetical protein